MKKLRTPLILLGILLALGGLARWDEWQTAKDATADKAKGRILEISPDDVTALDYASTGTDAPGAEPPALEKAAPPEPSKPVAATVTKADGKWRVTKPIDAPADGEAIMSFVKTLTDYSFGSVVTESKDKWAEYGVATPQRTITLTYPKDGAPQTFSLYVGNKAPVGYHVYFRTSAGGDKVYMGGQHLLLSTARSLDDFRDKTVVKIDEKTVKTLTYTARHQAPIELVKGDGGRYLVTKPEALEADDAEVRDFVDGLNGLHAESFVDKPNADEIKAFDNPDYVVSWTDDKGATQALKLLDKGNKIGATLDARARLYLIPDDQRSKVKKELLNFRNRRVLHIDSIDLAQVDVDGEKYTNEKGSWYKPNEKTDQTHVRAFVVDLEFARADQFLPPTDPAAKALTAPPLHRVTLAFKDSAKHPDVVIDVFAVPGQSEKVYVKRTGADTVYRVNKSVFNSMKPGTAPTGAVPGASSAMPDDGATTGGPPSDEDLPLEEAPTDLSKSLELKDNKG